MARVPSRNHGRYSGLGPAYSMQHTRFDSYSRSHRMIHEQDEPCDRVPKKPIDVNLIKKVFWLIKFVADYFFVKGTAPSGYQLPFPVFELPVGVVDFRLIVLKDPTAIVNVFRNLKLEPDEIRKIINQNCQARFSKRVP